MDELSKQLEEAKSKVSEFRALKMKAVNEQKWETAADYRDQERDAQAKCTFLELKIKDLEDKNIS